MGFTHFDQVAGVEGVYVGDNGNEVAIATADVTSGLATASLGSYTAAQTVGTDPGALVIASTVNLTQSTGPDNMTDLIADYSKISVIGAGSVTLTPVVEATRLNIGAAGVNSTISEGYVLQPILRKKGTGAVTALAAISAVLDVGPDNFSATGGINGMDLVIEGAATIAGGSKVKGISVDIKSGRVVEAGIEISCQADTVSGLTISNTPIAEVTLSSGVKVFTGSAATRAAVQAQSGPDTAPIGSLYIGTGFTATTKPNMYVKQAAAVWERVVTQAAD